MFSQILQANCCINDTCLSWPLKIGLRPPLPWSIIYWAGLFMSHRAAQRISGLPEVAMQILMDQLFSNPLTETGPLNFQQPALCADILASIQSWNWWVLWKLPTLGQPRKYQAIPPCIMLCNYWVYNIYIHNVYIYTICAYIYIPCIMYINYTLYRWLSMYNGSLHIPSWKNTPPVAQTRTLISRLTCRKHASWGRIQCAYLHHWGHMIEL